MYVFKANNPDWMAFHVYNALLMDGIERPSRNGRVLMLPEPATMIYTQPMNRCSFVPGRDANPIFHLMEAIWMLAGRRDVAFLKFFNQNMVNYSDNGATFNAAYGWRARSWMGDQLQAVIDILQEDPYSRQAVVQLWDPVDLGKDTKDKACNMSMVFSVTEENTLRLTVFNRSNDAVYGGVTGANPVHFSYFQQLVADSLDMDMEYLYFVSNNLHVYLDLYDHWEKMNWTEIEEREEPVHFFLPEDHEFGEFCSRVLECAETGDPVTSLTLTSSFMEGLAIPVANFWIERKVNKCPFGQIKWSRKIDCPQWQQAVEYWFNRRAQQ